MYYVIGLLFYIFALTPESYAAPELTRSELYRYTLLRDRFIIDRRLRGPHYESFFSLDLALSSGLKKMIGDISESTAANDTSVSGQVAEQAAIIELLNKNINSERYIDIDLYLAVPILKLNSEDNSLTVAPFFNLNIGASLSFDNQGDVVNPKAQTFLKKDLKLGIHTSTRHKNETYNVNIYRLSRADLLVSQTVQGIAENSTLIETDTLSDDKTMYMADLEYVKNKDGNEFLFAVEEIGPNMMSDKSTYGERPLIHARFSKSIVGESIVVRPYAGVHFRRRYTIDEGLYVANLVKLKRDEFPLSFLAENDNKLYYIVPQA